MGGCCVEPQIATPVRFSRRFSDNDLSGLYMSRELLPVSRDNLTCALQVDLRGDPAMGRRSGSRFFWSTSQVNSNSSSQFMCGLVQLGDPALDELRCAIALTATSN
ncbi:hypothetical protein HYE67_002868 [Fusarium culmorum]|uniref:Uncharacterized protein n=1 Tax=Fusarium culmorum TaxID=5516 RepID=A0A7S8D275_FUSCU|nr:hypothetical protein HYE67_002868 [Fusarium culmorum]